MNRKEFIKKCGYACLGSSLAMLSLESCVANISAKIVNSEVIVPLENFKDKTHFVVENERLKFPIYVLKISEENYSAVLMKCTHQGSELQAFGDILECPAHGSRFNQKGILKQGPADKNLYKFPVKIDNNQLKISLKNV